MEQVHNSNANDPHLGDMKITPESRPKYRARGRHSLQYDPGARDRIVKLPAQSQGPRKSLGHTKVHRRSSKEVILSPFRSVARRLGRPSWYGFQELSNVELDPNVSTPFHNASPAPEPQLYEPEPSAAVDIVNEPRRLTEDDLYSDTLSEKYPHPEDDVEINDQQQMKHHHVNVKQANSKGNTNFPVLVVQSLSKYTFVEDVAGAELALRSLRNLSLDRNMQGLLAKVGSIRASISAMERFFTKSITILQLGMLFLGDISRSSPQNREYVGRSGGLQLINRILVDRVTGQIQILERACITLRTVCAGCDYNAILSGVCGTVEAILKVMRRWKRCGALQERSLDVLTTLIHDASENAEVALDAGAASEVLSTIRQYPQDVDVLVAAARAACELARASETAREDMGGAGIISDLHQSLQTFSTNAEYTICAARCIRYLAFSSSNRARIARTTLATTLVTCLTPWQSDRKVIAAVLQALANVTYDEEAGKHGVVQGHGTSALVSTMDTYKLDKAITEAVCRVLRNASDGYPGTKRLVGRHGCVGRVARAIRSHVKNAGVQEHGCATLINLWSTHEVHIRAADLESSLSLAARTHMNNEDVMRQVNGLKSRIEKPSSSCGRAALVRLSQSVERRSYPKPSEDISGRNSNRVVVVQQEPAEEHLKSSSAKHYHRR